MKKIFVNRKPVVGPWGGGNKTLSTVCSYFSDNGWNITFDLEPDIDFLLCFDPRTRNDGLSYNHLVNYRKHNPDSKIIQRVGDVGTHSKPDLTELVKQTVEVSDVVIFASEWGKQYINPANPQTRVIPNAPTGEFYKNRCTTGVIDKKIKLVTHHWSTNDLKGFDVYSSLGQMINSGALPELELTYIGRYSEKYSRIGIEYVPPTDEKSLSELLPKFDIYLTASMLEAGANHVLEAIACGLPVVYRKDGGSINEYCEGYGIEYDHDMTSLLSAINGVKDGYEIYKRAVLNYDRTIDDVVQGYKFAFLHSL